MGVNTLNSFLRRLFRRFNDDTGPSLRQGLYLVQNSLPRLVQIEKRGDQPHPLRFEDSVHRRLIGTYDGTAFLERMFCHAINHILKSIFHVLNIA